MSDRTIAFRGSVRTVHAATGISNPAGRPPPWLATIAYAAVYLALCAGLLVGTMLVALAVGLALPGMAGPVVFLGPGLALVATTPTAARRSVIAIHNARQHGPRTLLRRTRSR